MPKNQTTKPNKDRNDAWIKIGGVWANKTKDGKNYLTLPLTWSSKIMIFKNGFKKSDTDPDYIAYLVPVDREYNSDKTDDKPDDSEDWTNANKPF